MASYQCSVVAFLLILVMLIENGYFVHHRSDAFATSCNPHRYRYTTATTTIVSKTLQYRQYQQHSRVNDWLRGNVQHAAPPSSTATTTSTEVQPQEETATVEIFDDDASVITSLLQITTISTTASIAMPKQQQSQLQLQLEADQRRTVLILLWCIAAISALDRVAMSVALVPMSYEYSPTLISDTMKGLISSLFSIGYGLAIIPAGLLISYISPKTLMTFGILIWSCATIVTPVSAEFITLTAFPILCVRSIVGMGEAILIPTVHRLLSVWTTSEQKSSGTCCSILYLEVPVIPSFIALTLL